MEERKIMKVRQRKKGGERIRVWMNSEIVGEILLIAKNLGKGRLLAAAQLY